MEQQDILDKPVTSKVAVYSPIEAGIKAMLEKHGSVLTHPPVVTGNTAALEAVKASRKELVTFRTTLEKTRVAEKAASLEYGKLVDAEAKRIQAFATPLELAYDAIVTAEEDRLETIRQAELEAERQRIAGHRARIQAIKDVRETANMCRTAERIKQLIDGMPAHLEPPFEEFQGEAETAFNEVCTVLQQLHDAKVEAEAQAAEVARQREELAAQQAEVNRKAAIQTRLTDIRMMLVKGASCATSVEIAHLLKELGLIVVDESFAEFTIEAEHTIDSVAEQLDGMHAAKVRAENLQREQDAAAAEQQANLDAMNQRELELQARERETADREAAHKRAINEQNAASSRPDPLTAQDIANGVVDAEVKPDEVLVLPGAPSVIVPIQTDHDGPPTLRLGQINERLAPIQLTADGLRALGFEPAGRARAAVLYHEQDFEAICHELVEHINSVCATEAV